MNHISEELLQEMVLGTLPADRQVEINNHLATCKACRDTLRMVQHEVELIGSLNPILTKPDVPAVRNRTINFSAWLKIAALLALGFFSGMGVSHITSESAICVVPQHLTPTAQPMGRAEITICEALALHPGK